MKTVATSVMCFLLLLSHLRADEEVSVQQILTRHTQAIGGTEALRSIQSLRLALNIIEPTFQVDAVYVADRDTLMRIDVFVGEKRVYSEGFDGKIAWEMGENASSLKEESPAGSTALQNGILSPDRFYSLEELVAKGHKLEAKGREEVNGVAYYVFELNLNAQITRLYINPETWLIERTRETKAVHPDIDPTPQTTETVYSDFRNAGGVVRPFKSVRTDLGAGKIIQTETISKVETNPDLDTSFFEKPSKQ